LKDYLNRFCVVLVRLQSPNKEMVVATFVKGLRANPFSDSLIWNNAESMAEVRERAMAHNEAE